MLSNIGIGKRNCHYSKYPINIKNFNNEKIMTSNKVSFNKNCFKYITGQKDIEKVTFLCITLPKMSGYAKFFDKTKYIFAIDKTGLTIKETQKHSIIWDKVSKRIQKGLGSNQ